MSPPSKEEFHIGILPFRHEILKVDIAGNVPANLPDISGGKMV
jgi:hypothetical protein